MQNVVEFANMAGEVWVRAMWPAVWQSTLFAGGVFLLTAALRRASASLRFWLWMLVPLRLLVAPLVVVSLPLLPVQEDATTSAAAADMQGRVDSVASHQTHESGRSEFAPPYGPLRGSRAPARPAPPAQRLGFGAFAMLAWLAGTLALAVRMACAWTRMRRIVAAATPMKNAYVSGAASRAATAYGLRRVPDVLVTDEPLPPFACGVLRPVVVLSKEFLRAVRPEGLGAVLAHEFAHIRRRDPLKGFVVALCQTAYFFHPAAHLARRGIALERERACDALVLGASKAEPRLYAHALLAAAGVSRTAVRAPMPAIAATESFGDLKVRLRAIARTQPPAAGVSRTAIAFLLVLGMLCVPTFAVVPRAVSDTPPQTVAPPDRTESPSADGAVVAAATPAVELGDGSRVLQFPANTSLGTLKIRKIGAEYDALPFAWWMGDEQSWQDAGPASGAVTIPADHEVRLDVGVTSAGGLAALKQLPPDALHMLALQNPETADRDLRHIEHLTGLRVLYLSWTKVTDAGLDSVKALRDLEKLTLPGWITTRGVARLSSLSRLKSLHFSETQVTSDFLAMVAQNPALEELGLWKGHIESAALSHLENLPRLRWLLLAFSDATDRDLQAIARISTLTSLDLRGCVVTDQGVAGLTSLTHLEELCLNNTPVTNACMPHLTRFKGLRFLNLFQTPVDDGGLVHLQGLDELEYLELPNRGISDAGLAEVGRLTNLRSLWVGASDACEIGDAGMAHVGRLTRLERLVIGGNNITDAGVMHLTNLKRLRELTIPYVPKASDASMQAIASISSLKVLSLPRKSNVTVSGLNRLNRLSGLHTLHAQNAIQDYTGLDLSGLTNLEKLSLHVTTGVGKRPPGALRDEDLAFLAKMPQLKWVQVGENKGITNAGLEHLANLEQLDRLTIGGPGVTDAGLVHLSDKTALGYIRLTGDITDAGLRHLEPLKLLRTLGITSPHEFSPQATARLQAELPALHWFNGESGIRTSR
ncbi:MAG: M48 family metalloprotease [bacterium]|nr:M48 family metalloprotease [bacterium]